MKEIDVTKILFVCSANADRSPTAERIYKDREGFEVKSAGISRHAQVQVSAELLEWADVILCMEEWQKYSIQRTYAGIISDKEIGHLNVPDMYPYMYPKLIDLITEKVDAWLLEHQRV